MISSPCLKQAINFAVVISTGGKWNDILDLLCFSVRTNQQKVDWSDPVLISLCSSVVQNQSNTEL